eukprot:TRINITY_DN32263_c0_g1_i1.p1 TRINITY_DN32263_c0_g1~~TRINITY_DN32263_c0_g1_i1.p1  ORF type:complete len:541 (+),score=114.71 TRINITY_DN32263_c0_g1_i1:55-1677(+)
MAVTNVDGARLLAQSRGGAPPPLPPLPKSLGLPFAPPERGKTSEAEVAKVQQATPLPACVVCGRNDVPLKACGNCKEPLYCQAECQRKHWKVHKGSCVGKAAQPEASLSSAKAVTSTSSASAGSPLAPVASSSAQPAASDALAKDDQVTCDGKTVQAEAAAALDFSTELFKFVQSVGPGKGGGILATAFIPSGTVLLQDRPIITIKADEFAVGRREWKGPSVIKYDRRHELIKQKFEKLAPAEQETFLSLEDTITNNSSNRQVVDRLHQDEKIGLSWDKLYSLTSIRASLILPGLQDGTGFKSPEGIFTTNSLPTRDRDESAVYPRISRFNHSCANNAVYRWSEKLGAQIVMAVRDIKPGTEICVSYFNCRFRKRAERHDRTLLSWGFRCQCEACEIPASRIDHAFVASLTDGDIQREKSKAAARSDANRVRLGKLNVALKKASTLKEVEESCAEMRDIYAEEGLLPNVQIEQQLALELLRANVAYEGSEQEAWCRRACELSTLVEGAEHESTRQLLAWIETPPSLSDLTAFLKGHRHGS